MPRGEQVMPSALDPLFAKRNELCRTFERLTRLFVVKLSVRRYQSLYLKGTVGTLHPSRALHPLHSLLSINRRRLLLTTVQNAYRHGILWRHCP